MKIDSNIPPVIKPINCPFPAARWPMTVAFRSILQGRHFYINQSFVLGEAEAAAAAGGYNTLTAHNSRSPASSTAAGPRQLR